MEYGGTFSTEPSVTVAYPEPSQIIYYEELYSEPCVTLAYLKPWHIQDPRHIHNTVKHLS